jgi:hypothetical protein
MVTLTCTDKLSNKNPRSNKEGVKGVLVADEKGFCLGGKAY